jgi:hypothetical protein
MFRENHIYLQDINRMFALIKFITFVKLLSNFYQNFIKLLTNF